MDAKRRLERRASRVACMFIAIHCAFLGELMADEGRDNATRYLAKIESRLVELKRSNKYGAVHGYLEELQKAEMPPDVKGTDLLNAIVDRMGGIAKEYDERRRVRVTPEDWELERQCVLFGFWKLYLRLDKNMRASVVSRSIENASSPFMRLFLFELLENDPTAKVFAAGSAIRLLADKRDVELPNPLAEKQCLRLCDFAYKYLITLIKESGARCELLEKWEVNGGIDYRDRTIAELKQWLKDHPRTFEEAFGQKTK